MMGLFNSRKSWLVFAAGACCAAVLWSQRQPTADIFEQFKKRSAEFESKGLAEPFKGFSTSQGIEPNLWAIRSTGVSTEPVRKAAEAFLASLNADQAQESRPSMSTTTSGASG